MFKSSPCNSPLETQTTSTTTTIGCSSPLSLLLGFSDDDELEDKTSAIHHQFFNTNSSTTPKSHPPSTNNSVKLLNPQLPSNKSGGNRNTPMNVVLNSPFNMMSNTMDSDDQDDLMADIDSPMLEFVGENNPFQSSLTMNSNSIKTSGSSTTVSDSSSSSLEKPSQISSDSSSLVDKKKSSSLKNNKSMLSNNNNGATTKTNSGGSTLTIKSKAKSTPIETEKNSSIKKKKSTKKLVETPKKKKVEFKKVESSSDSSDSSSESEHENKKKRKKPKVVEEKKWKKKKVEENSNNSNHGEPVASRSKKSLCRQFTEMISEIKKTTRKKEDFDVSDSDDFVDISSSEDLLSESEEIVKRKGRKKVQEKKKLFSNIQFVISNSLIENDKEKLEKKIKEENGTIIRQLSSNNVDTCQNGKIVLISEKTSTKPTYLIALLLDIPILKKDWVFDSIAKKKIITHDKTVQKYLLDRGIVRSRVDPSVQHIEKQVFNSSLMCCKKENRIFYGCRVKILGNEKELSSWISILIAGGAIIDNELTIQTSEGSNFIFVKDSNNLTEEDIEKATLMKLPILDGDSLLQIVTTLERKFSEEQVLNYVELSQVTKKSQPLPSINLLEMSMPLIELPDETDVINNMDLIDKIEFGNFFEKSESNLTHKLSFTRIATCNGDTICEKYYIHDMVVLHYLNEEIICRIDTLYYCGNIPTLDATQYYSNTKRKLQKTERKITCSLEHVKYKLNICGTIRNKSQHFYSNQRFSTKTQIISDIIEDIKTVGETCLGLEKCKEHKFKWLPPFKTNLYNDYISVSTLKWRSQSFQQGDFILIKQKHSDIQLVGQITEMRENDTNVFAIPSNRKFPISHGSLFVEIFEKIPQNSSLLIDQDVNNSQSFHKSIFSNLNHYKTLHEVLQLNIESIQHLQLLVAIHHTLFSTLHYYCSNNLIIIHQ